jgi:hypothetical protein
MLMSRTNSALCTIMTQSRENGKGVVLAIVFVTSCSHNARVVPNGMEEEFKTLAQRMYTAVAMDNYQDAVTTFSQRFPRASKWLA